MGFFFKCISVSLSHVDHNFEMADFQEQSVCIKFCFRLCKSVTETHEVLKQAFGKIALGCMQTLEQHLHF